MKATIDYRRNGRPMSRPSDLGDQAQAAAGALMAIADCIRRLGRVPSGHLYAQLMGHMSLETYEALIGILIDAGKVERLPSHLLVWIGPGWPINKPTQTRKETAK